MKNHLASLTAVLLAGTMFLGFGTTARAQYSSQRPEEIPGQYPSQQSPNDLGAARVSFIHGDLSTQHNNSGEWVAATLNTPVVNGDHISTGQRSRAEIQLDHANVLRMSDESTANVVNLSRTQIQLQVGQGLVNYDVMRGSEANVEIDTPNVAIRPQMNEGSYRIAVNSDGETIVDVRKGSAEISTPQGSTRVERDQRITIQGNADNAQYNVSSAYGKDDWDKWNRERDHVIDSAESWHHTNHYYTGSQDLDSYGHWSDVPDYGSVWFPSADPSWAPYRDGRWVYEPNYDWTWVSYEPWGWAPYHYGRWFVYGGNWGWWPGPVYDGYRPIWAPAYVSFFGFGGGGWDVGVGFGGGFGSVGWLPCGPGDRFYPWYGAGYTQVNVVNIYNIHNDRDHGFAPLREGQRGFSNVDRAFTDPRVRGGISSMGSDRFGRERVPTHQERLDPRSLQQASVITGGHPVAPSHESFRPSDRQVNPGAIPNRAGSNQRFFSNARQGGSPQQVQGGFNRGGNTQGNQPQQNTQRPGFRGFGQSNSGNENSGNRQSGANSGGQQPQQNGERPGFRGFGPHNSNNVNRGTTPEQGAGEQQGNNQRSRGLVPPQAQQAPANPSGRPGFRQFTPPARAAQPEASTTGGSYGGQSRPNYSQPRESPQQYQNNARGNPGGYSRPPLNMQQPVVTPRGEGNYSSPRSAPGGSYGGGPSGGGYRGGPPSGGERNYSTSPSAPSRGNYGGGPSGGGYRGEPPSGGERNYSTPPSAPSRGNYGGGPSGGGYRGGPPSGGERNYSTPPSAPSRGNYGGGPSGGGYRGAPPSGGNGGGGYRGGPSEGGNRGGDTGGGSRGGSSGGGGGSSSSNGHSSSGRNGR